MNKYIKFVVAGLFIAIFRLIPLNWILGSFNASFSCSTMVAPVIAQQLGLGWVSLFFISGTVFSTTSIFLFLLRRIPLFFAGSAFQNRQFMISIVVPAFCMILFVSHDVGRQAWYYSLYWFIPMVLFYLKDSRYNRALSASFIAHAVGSVIWLYTTYIPVAIWRALIPVVFCERMLIAGGIVVVDYLFENAKNIISKILHVKRVSNA